MENQENTVMSKDIFCTQCGAKNDFKNKFCINCGINLINKTQSIEQYDGNQQSNTNEVSIKKIGLFIILILITLLIGFVIDNFFITIIVIVIGLYLLNTKGPLLKRILNFFLGCLFFVIIIIIILGTCFDFFEILQM